MNAITKLENLKKQKNTLDARIQLAEARLKKQNRKQDTRRKILIGSYYLDKVQKNNTMNEITNIMNDYLTRDNDRELFGLKPLKKHN